MSDNHPEKVNSNFIDHRNSWWITRCLSDCVEYQILDPIVYHRQFFEFAIIRTELGNLSNRINDNKHNSSITPHIATFFYTLLIWLNDVIRTIFPKVNPVSDKASKSIPISHTKSSEATVKLLKSCAKVVHLALLSHAALSTLFDESTKKGFDGSYFGDDRLPLSYISNAEACLLTLQKVAYLCHQHQLPYWEKEWHFSPMLPLSSSLVPMSLPGWVDKRVWLFCLVGVLETTLNGITTPSFSRFALISGFFMAVEWAISLSGREKMFHKTDPSLIWEHGHVCFRLLWECQESFFSSEKDFSLHETESLPMKKDNSQSQESLVREDADTHVNNSGSLKNSQANRMISNRMDILLQQILEYRILPSICHVFTAIPSIQRGKPTKTSSSRAESKGVHRQDAGILRNYPRRMVMGWPSAAETLCKLWEDFLSQFFMGEPDELTSSLYPRASPSRSSFSRTNNPPPLMRGEDAVHLFMAVIITLESWREVLPIYVWLQDRFSDSSSLGSHHDQLNSIISCDTVMELLKRTASEEVEDTSSPNGKLFCHPKHIAFAKMLFYNFFQSRSVKYISYISHRPLENSYNALLKWTIKHFSFADTTAKAMVMNTEESINHPIHLTKGSTIRFFPFWALWMHCIGALLWPSKY